MSAFIGNPSIPIVCVQASGDERNLPNWWRTDVGFSSLSPVDIPWPRSRTQGYSYTAEGVIWDGYALYWPIRYRGMRTSKTIKGITKDSGGAALAGVTVKAYRTSTDIANSNYADAEDSPATVSEADGAYTICVTNTDQHYLIAYKVAAPDVAGTTVNTLTGS